MPRNCRILPDQPKKRKNFTVQFRCTDRDRFSIREAAESVGLNDSAFILQAVLLQIGELRRRGMLSEPEQAEGQ